MDWKTFIAEIIKSLSWPAVVIFVIWLLQDKISELLPRLKKLKYKDAELEFIEGIKELAEEAKPKIIEETDNIKHLRKSLQNTAAYSSRAAILEAYLIVELSAIKAIEKAYPELQGKDIKKQVVVSKMLREKVLSMDRYFQLRELLQLRNKAAHNEDFSLTGSPIETYIDVALSLANELNHFDPKNEEKVGKA